MIIKLSLVIFTKLIRLLFTQKEKFITGMQYSFVFQNAN